MAPGVDGPGIEIKFAHKLAGNEKEGRDKSLRKLKKWIELKSNPESTESAYTELELLKLWKGLFFCMWMSDKPLVQEQLAEELAQLVHLFPHWQDAVTFCRTFFTTMAREWPGIDVIRREKFMMLVRRVLRQSLTLAAATDWTGPVSDGVRAVYTAAFARPEDPASLPLGLQLHCIEIFLEEVAKVGRGRITPQQLAPLLQPFIQVLTVSRQSTLRSTVTDSIFYHLMRQSDEGIASDAQLHGPAAGAGGDDGDDDDSSSGSGGGDSAGESEDQPGGGPMDPRAGGVDVVLPQLQVDYNQLADALVQAGEEASVRQIYRAALYRLGQQFRDLSEGVYPLAVRFPTDVDSGSDISDDDMQAAVERLKETQRLLNRDSRSKRQRDVDDVGTEESPPPKKKRRVRSKVALSNGVIDTGEAMMAEAAGPPPRHVKESEPAQAVRKTLKEKRRKKLMEKRGADAAKQEQKRRKRENKEVKLNGDFSEHEARVMENGLVLDDVPTKKKKKKGNKLEAFAEKDELAVPEMEHEICFEVQNSASNRSVTKKLKKMSSPNVCDTSIEGNRIGLGESALAKKKTPKKCKSSKASDTPEISSAASIATAEQTACTPSRKKKRKVEKSARAEPQPRVEARSVEIPSLMKRTKKPAGGGDASAAAALPTPSTATGKLKKAAAPAACAAGTGGGSGDTARREAAIDWTLPTTDDWGEPEPGAAGSGGGSGDTARREAAIDWTLPTTDDWGEPEPGDVDIFVPSKKRAKAQQAAAAAIGKFARFVPCKPVAAFVKKRSVKKRSQESLKSPFSPSTPTVKKVKINLANNQAQGFKEHLITVRNSPQVPHDPDLRPAKGLLKSPAVVTPTMAARVSKGSQSRRRSCASDFFCQ